MSATGGSWAWTDDTDVVHSLDRPNLRVRTLTHPYSVPPLVGDDVQLASYPGEFFLTKQHGARRISLELLLFDPDGFPANVYGVIQELAQCFGIANQGTLTHYRPDGSIVTAKAQVNGWTSARADAGPFNPVQQGPTGIWYIAVVPFVLSDPYFYGPSFSLGPTDISGGTGVQTLVHPGTVRGWKAVFSFAGPCTNPKVTNGANTWSVQALTTVASGQTLVIDCSAWTAMNGASNLIGSVVHAGGFPFMMIEPGSNVLSITGGTGSPATLTSTFSPPYL
ncbi:MAG: hypothetical protein ACRDGQ_06690 [Candidatus Limnocylindrales bacterium]